MNISSCGTFRVLALSILLFAGFLLPGTPVVAFRQILTVEPGEGRAGDVVRISGESFTPSIVSRTGLENTVVSYASIYFQDRSNLVGRAVIDEWGQFETDITLGEYPAGTYNIWVYDESSGPDGWVSALFEVKTGINLSRNSGYEGDIIRVGGTGFTTYTSVTVYFNGKKISTVLSDSNGSFYLDTFIIPKCSWTDNRISAEDMYGKKALAGFTTRHQKLEPGIVTVTAEENMPVAGTGFTAGARMTFNLYSRDIIHNNISTIPAAVIAGASGNFTAILLLPVNISDTYIVEATDGVFTTSAILEIIPDGKLNRVLGFTGTEVSFSVSGFLPEMVAVISFDDIPFSEAVTGSGGSLAGEFRIPPCVPGEHVISISDGINTRLFPFTVLPKARISASRDSGYVGCEITVSGSGFLAGKVAVVSVNGIPVSEALIDSTENFISSFFMPASPAGENEISVTDGFNTLSEPVFIESEPPPVPGLSVPGDFLPEKREMHLSWENVTDPSGVNYTIQIASGSSFLPETIVVERKELAIPEFTFIPAEDTEKVQYYWRIRAVDGAYNTGDWSETGSFGIEAGKSPVFSYGLMGEVAALGGLFVFWLIKKRRA